MLEQGKAGSRLSDQQLELIQDYDMVRVPWRVDADGNVVELPCQKFASRPNSSEQIQCYSEVDYSQCIGAEVESLAEFK